MTGSIAIAKIEQEKDKFIGLAKNMWEHPETGYNEVMASKWTAELLESFGFEVEVGYANLPTCVMAKYGSGKPVIGLLGELDALPGMSQKVGTTIDPVVPGAAGQGCGHNLLNTACLSAAVGIKAEMEEKHLPGTLIFFGCPAEELLTGKVFMAREGAFDELDAAIAWHGASHNEVESGNSNGLNSAIFHFKGITAHAGGDPYNGRSALDAAELMSVGANYLREHVTGDIRIHYVYKDAGTAPNIVPDKASVWYYVRGGSRKNIESAYNRLVKVAEGAAHMTETELSIEFLGGCYNSLHNDYLCKIAYESLCEIGVPTYTEEEQAFAEALNKQCRGYEDALKAGAYKNGAISAVVEKYEKNDKPGGGSTDVSDVAHICPTVAIDTACWNLSAPGHSWMITSCSGMSIGFKGMLYGGKAIAATAVKLFENPDHVVKAKEEFDRVMAGEKYNCPITKDIPIPQPKL